MTSSYKELEKIIKKVKAKGGTNIETAFQKADKLLDKVESGKDVVKNIVLCSDGLPQSGKKLSSGKYTKKDHSSYYKYANAVYKKAKEVKKKGIYIYALGFFHNSKDKDLKFGKKFMEDIASADKYYSIKNTKDIEQAMKKIAKKITSVSINKKKATMRVKDTLHLYVTINGVPASAVWTSSDPSVAAVNTDGTVTAFKKGNVIITATVDGKQKLTCAIKVKPAPTIKIRSSISLYKGCKKKLKVKVTGKSKKVKWKSSNKKVVRVTKKGTLIAVKPGRAVITVKANGVKATCNVTVLKPTISIAVNKYLNKVVLFKKESQKLKVTVHGKSKKVKWKSTNPKVAGVTKKGTVKARKTGVCYIIATANGVSAKVKVKVEQRHPVRSFYRKVKTSITPKGSKKINEEGAQLITENKKEKIQKAAVCIYKQNGNYYFVAACTGKNLTSLICNCYLGYNGKKVYDAYNTAGHYSYMNKYYFQKDSYGVWSLYGTYAPIRFNVTDQYGRYLTPKGTGVNGKYFRSFKDLNKMKKWLQK